MRPRIDIFEKIYYLNFTGNFHFVQKFRTQNGKIINISTSGGGEGRGEGRESYSKCDLLQLCVDLSNYWDLKLNKKVRVAFLC